MKKILKTLGVYCFMAIWTIFTAPITIVAFITWYIHGGPRRLDRAARLFSLQSVMSSITISRRYGASYIYDERDVRMGVSSLKRELNKWLRINVDMLEWAGEYCVPAHKAYDLINKKLKNILAKHLRTAYK